MINKITEDSFTKTGKGLMTLFCIGIVHLVLGIKLENAKIEIPWMPSVLIDKPENLSYLFVALLIYSIWRYLIYSTDSITKLLADSLVWGLNSLVGGFISHKLVTGGSYYKVSLHEHISKDSRYGVKYTIMTEDPETPSATFYIELSGIAKICRASISEHPAISPIYAIENKQLSKRWRLSDNSYSLPQDEAEQGISLYESYGAQYLISSVFFVFNLLCGSIYCIFSPKHFDFLIPVVLNVGLLLYWIHSKNLL